MLPKGARTPATPIWHGLGRYGRLDRQRRIQKITNRPGPIGDAEYNGRRGRYEFVRDYLDFKNKAHQMMRPPTEAA
jgi:hypothetical protein